MKVCGNCGYENDDGAKFCKECGRGFENPFVFQITKKYYIRKMQDIVDKYIGEMNASAEGYNSACIRCEDYADVMRTVQQNFCPEVPIQSFLGFLDTTVFGKGKSGLLFTSEKIYEKGFCSYIAIPYSEITCLEMEKKNLVFRGLTGYGRGLDSIGEAKILSLFYNPAVIKECLEELLAVYPDSRYSMTDLEEIFERQALLENSLNELESSLNELDKNIKKIEFV